MAILSKIRERSMALIIVIGLALFAFVLDPSTLTDFFNSSKVNEIGAVDGETISRQEFAAALEAYRANTGSRVSEMQAAKTVWDNLVRQKIYKEQLAQAGITIGEEDVWQQIILENQNASLFLNEAGLFDEDKLKEYASSAINGTAEQAAQWNQYVKGVAERLETNTYNKLVSSGIGASLKEAENKYMIDYTKLNGSYVYLPYTSIPDSTVSVTKADIENYIKAHRDQYKVDPSRNISYVKFDVVASEADENAIKNEVASLLEDREEYNNVSNQNETLLGLKNATDISIFFEDNSSDLPLDTIYTFKKDMPAVIADEIVKGKKGDTFGPYKDGEYFKITKILEVTKMPDSVKASHILIPFVGAARAGANITQTEEQAKVTADSIAKVVKRRKSKFAELAKEFSSDVSNASKGGSLDKFDYRRMVPEFRDYAFNGKKGDIGVVKTAFGFHVIMIEDQNKPQNAFRLATFSRKIEPSKETENKAFQNAEEFSLALSNGTKINEAAKTKGYEVRPSLGLKVLDENISGLGNQRQIVAWSFGKDTKVGDYKRFDIDKGHVVAVLTDANEEGLSSAASVINTVKPILMNEAKAKLLAEKMNGASLADIAKANNTNVRAITNATLSAPSITGVGTEPKVLGAMYNAEQDQLYTKIVGDKGVFAFVLKSKELPTALPNYEVKRNQMAATRKGQSSFKIFQAIKKAADIEDNRPAFYGLE
jgi:peptidylprolyl isomerase/peptidyl-prolyl cis-trans isomerase D